MSRIAAHEVLFRPHVLVRGLMAHGVAEALLNAPQILGSLQLLFNPTGLVQSVRQGVADLIGLPLAALQARSASQFLSGLGLGSMSLVRHISGTHAPAVLICSCCCYRFVRPCWPGAHLRPCVQRLG